MSARAQLNPKPTLTLNPKPQHGKTCHFNRMNPRPRPGNPKPFTDSKFREAGVDQYIASTRGIQGKNHGSNGPYHTVAGDKAEIPHPPFPSTPPPPPQVCICPPLLCSIVSSLPTEAKARVYGIRFLVVSVLVQYAS